MPKKSSKPLEININLAAKDPFFETALGRILRWALSAGRYIVIFTELVVILSFVTRFSLDRQVTDLNDAINKKQSVVESYGDLENNFRTLQSKVDNYQQIEQRANLAEIFPKLSAIMPDRVQLDELNIRPDRVILSGTAFSQSALNLLINNLQLSPDFLNVRVNQIESVSERSAGLSFSISAETQAGVTVKKEGNAESQ